MIRCMLRSLVKATLLYFLTGCNGLVVNGSLDSSRPVIEGLDRLSAKPGESVTVRGKFLTDDIEVMVNDQPAAFKRIDEKTGSIEMPSDMGEGLARLSFFSKSKPIARLPLMNADFIDKISPTTIPLESICDSYIVKTGSGELVRGKVNCKKQQTLCNQEGQSSCTTTEAFPAVVKGGLASLGNLCHEPKLDSVLGSKSQCDGLRQIS